MPTPSSRLRRRVAAAIADAGYHPDEPLVVGLSTPDTEDVVVAHGADAQGRPVRADTLTYTASVAKQLTAACAAVLVARGGLALDSTLSGWLPELPAWADAVRVRHLLHHTAALPADDDLDALRAVPGAPDRTTDGVLGALASAPHLAARPGTRFAYANAGYVCLATVVERAARRPLADVADEHLFAPAGMTRTRFWSGPAPAPPDAAPLDPAWPAPLSRGDGGVWSTAADLLRWNRSLDQDLLGLRDVLQTPGRLDDGTPLDYAWGLGVRAHHGHRVYRHGGAWADLRIMLARAPDLELSTVAIALSDETERTVALTEGLLSVLPCCSPRTPAAPRGDTSPPTRSRR